MSDSKVKLHIHLKSEMRDAYDSFHTVGRSQIDIAASETVEKMKFNALAALGEFSELRDVHHTKCKFVCGVKQISPEDDAKCVSEIGVQEGAELHVILPFGHDSVLAQPSGADAADGVSSPASPTFKLHVQLKSMIRDAYDSIIPAGRAELDINSNDTILDFKAKAFGALGEISELRDVHHTHCHFHVEGGNVLGPEKDKMKVKDFPVLCKNGAVIDVMLPMGNDK